MDIQHALELFIQEELKRNYQFLAKYNHQYTDQKDLISISPAKLEDINITRPRATGYNSRWYTFTELQSPQDLRRTVAVNVLPGRQATVDNMTVFHFSYMESSYCVTPATTWLRDTYHWDTTYEVSRFPEKQYDEQRRWWDTNGNKFRLLDLPAEMREAIYLHTIGPVVVPDTTTETPDILTLGRGIAYGDKKRPGSNRDPDIERPNTNILRVNKQVRKEATEVAQRDTTKRFTALGVQHLVCLNQSSKTITPLSRMWAKLPNSSTPTAFLRHLQLEMSAAMYFRFAGIDPREGGALRAIPSSEQEIHISTLSNFDALQTLDFRFISPKHRHAICPWALTHGASSTDKHSCQMIWIHWFFVFAYQALKDINNKRDSIKGAKRVSFSLSGCVKNSTRTYWERVLNDRSGDQTAAIKQMEQNIRREVTGDGPIPCKCSTPCAKPDDPALYQFSEHVIRNSEGLQEFLDKVYWDFED